MKRIEDIKTKEQALAYLTKVLGWEAFCTTHRLLERSIQIILAHHAPEPVLKKRRCVICKKLFSGYGHNPQPVKDKGECCQECNIAVIVPTRLLAAKGGE